LFIQYIFYIHLSRLGSWIKGFAINTDIYSSVKAELWAVVKGVELARMLGIQKLVLESKIMLVVNQL
jgi:hypothetical protein